MKIVVILSLVLVSGIALWLIGFPHKEIIGHLVMPGALTQSHAKYESQCESCHHENKKANQNDLCLKCHEDVAKDLQAHLGFHGHSQKVEGKQCKLCHGDHKGRAFDIIKLDTETFRHDWTGFTLKGAHARLSVTCQACHIVGKKFREAPIDCLNCHSKDDRHKGQLGKNCADCHKEASWSQAYFQHSKTKFPLTGKHQKVICNACHTTETYKDTPITCVACHMVNDVHSSPSQEKCERCHNSEDWKKIEYDHNKKTKFILDGVHVKVTCNGCHVANVFKTKLGTQCIDCHQVDDVHKGKNGTNCASCHSNVDWKKIAFNHNKDTHFKLLGKHAQVSCEACHKVSSKDMKINTSCSSCHQAQDVHKGKQGNSCEKCHNDQGWQKGIKFDHDLTSFPLIGQHAVVSCNECHHSLDFKEAKADCLSCHDKDDFHKKALGYQCATCHNPNGWKLWRFNHDTQTKYKLEKAHAGIKCQACHQLPMEKEIKVSNRCIDCHEKEDVHQGQFGENCEMCHGVDSFKNYSIRKGM